MIDRVKLSATAKQQLITLKRRTGIEHYNVICRHALCTSLANKSSVPTENMQFAGGLEIDWKIFAGEAEATYLNLVIARCLADEGQCTADLVRRTVTQHVHRGLSYLTSKLDAFAI
jgi:DNA sulfur modification protein DndE